MMMVLNIVIFIAIAIIVTKCCSVLCVHGNLLTFCLNFFYFPNNHFDLIYRLFFEVFLFFFQHLPCQFSSKFYQDIVHVILLLFCCSLQVFLTFAYCDSTTCHVVVKATTRNGSRGQLQKGAVITWVTKLPYLCTNRKA